MSKYSMIKHLPPLNSLVIFEAAGRLGSFKSAANELNQTPAAVAYQIKKLEESLNIELFDRMHKGVILNKAGQNYLKTVSGLLTSFTHQTQQFKATYGQSSLTVLTLHAIAEKWLMPRLTDYRENHPGIHIEIKATDNLDTADLKDFVIGFSLTMPDPIQARVLFEEEIFPVCSSRYLNNLGDELNSDALADYDLLIDAHWKQDWDLWLKKNKSTARLNLTTGFSFSLYAMVIEAAVNGMGMMMGHKQLIQKELQSGSLIRVFKNARSLNGYYYYYYNKHKPADSAADQFQAWLQQQV